MVTMKLQLRIQNAKAGISWSLLYSFVNICFRIWLAGSKNQNALVSSEKEIKDRHGGDLSRRCLLTQSKASVHPPDGWVGRFMREH
jgi:hypothetical protein